MIKRLYIFASFIAFFNILDGILTYYWYIHDLGREANPLMAYLLNISPNLFLGFKFALTPIWFWCAKKNYSAGIMGVFVLFSILTLYWLFLIALQFYSQTF